MNLYGPFINSPILNITTRGYIRIFKNVGNLIKKKKKKKKKIWWKLRGGPTLVLFRLFALWDLTVFIPGPLRSPVIQDSKTLSLIGYIHRLSVPQDVESSLLALPSSGRGQYDT